MIHDCSLNNSSSWHNTVHHFILHFSSNLCTSKRSAVVKRLFLLLLICQVHLSPQHDKECHFSTPTFTKTKLHGTMKRAIYLCCWGKAWPITQSECPVQHSWSERGFWRCVFDLLGLVVQTPPFCPGDQASWGQGQVCPDGL